MNRPDETTRIAGQPDLAQLFAQYMRRQVVAAAQGIGDDRTPGEIALHEAVPAQPADPRFAWEGAVAALGYLPVEARSAPPPSPLAWQPLITSLEPRFAVPFAAGNFPQMLRDLQPLLQSRKLGSLRPAPSSPPQAAPLVDGKGFMAEPADAVSLLLAAGLLRLTRHFDRADKLLKRAQQRLPSQSQPTVINEQAALAWQRGQPEQAGDLWQDQPSLVPALFNLGMALLFLDRPAEARAPLHQAVAAIPQEDPWHHLGQMYLALAEMR